MEQKHMLAVRELGSLFEVRGGLAFKAHRLLYHPTVGLIVIKNKKKEQKHMLAARELGALFEVCPHTSSSRNSISLYRNVQWFRGGLVFEAHRHVYLSA